MKILNVEFVTSAAAGGSDAGIPRDGLPQIAFAGRSNVGKSTLIHALARTRIARTSAAPGKTRLANVFRLDLESAGGPGRRRLYFVDLPGYGYARGGADSANELAAVSEAYFAAVGRGVSPAGGAVIKTLLLVDSRHPGLPTDIHAFEWLQRVGAMPGIVATKIDKLSRAERTRNLKQMTDAFGTIPLAVSADKGEGLEDLWKAILATGATPATEQHRRTRKHTDKL